MTLRLSVIAAACLFIAASPASAYHMNSFNDEINTSPNAEIIPFMATCSLHFKGKHISSGPCRGIGIADREINIDGMFDGQGKEFHAAIDLQNGKGELLGPNNEILSRGTLLADVRGTHYTWPSGHSLDILIEIVD